MLVGPHSGSLTPDPAGRVGNDTDKDRMCCVTGSELTGCQQSAGEADDRRPFQKYEYLSRGKTQHQRVIECRFNSHTVGGLSQLRTAGRREEGRYEINAPH